MDTTFLGINKQLSFPFFFLFFLQLKMLHRKTGGEDKKKKKENFGFVRFKVTVGLWKDENVINPDPLSILYLFFFLSLIIFSTIIIH
jgi:hypothetical protein